MCCGRQSLNISRACWSSEHDMSSSLSSLEDSLEERNLGERRFNPYGSVVADNEAMEEDEAVEIEEV